MKQYLNLILLVASVVMSLGFGAWVYEAYTGRVGMWTRWTELNDYQREVFVGTVLATLVFFGTLLASAVLRG